MGPRGAILFVIAVLLCACYEDRESNFSEFGYVLTITERHNLLKWEGSTSYVASRKYCSEVTNVCYVSHTERDLDASLSTSSGKDLVALSSNNIDGRMLDPGGYLHVITDADGTEIPCENCNGLTSHLRSSGFSRRWWVGVDKLFLDGIFSLGKSHVYRAYRLDFSENKYTLRRIIEVSISSADEIPAPADYSAEASRLALVVCKDDCKLIVQGINAVDRQETPTNCGRDDRVWIVKIEGRFDVRCEARTNALSDSDPS